MRKYTFFFFLLAINLGGFAQGSLDVEITPSLVNPVCKNTAVTLTASPTNAGVAPQFLWVLENDTIPGDSTFTTAVNAAFVEVILISSIGSQQDTATDSYQIINTTIDATYEFDDAECNQETVDVSIGTINGIPHNEPYTYNLAGGTGNLGQQAIYTDLFAGSTFVLTITDGLGCTDTTLINTVVKTCALPSPSEVITPNGDGENDRWTIGNIEQYPDNEVFIFDRWGQRVYHKKEYDNADGWEAKYVGGDLPVSTYYFILEITQEKSDDLVIKGAISVFR